MKKTLILTAVLLAGAPIAALASCERVKADISQKIVNNGVPESGFKLEIVPNDQADQVVGHCENDTQKIVYTRLNNGEDRGDAAQTGTSQDTSNTQ